MEYRIIDTQGIRTLMPVPGSSSWYYACTDTDLYETQQLYQDHALPLQRLLFIYYPKGCICEPIPPEEGLCYGEPVCINDRMYILTVHFGNDRIRILEADHDLQEMRLLHEMQCSSIADCYNLRLSGSPLTLYRQEAHLFELLWPEYSRFAIAPQESFDRRDNDSLLFTKWTEDPEYREETLIRNLQGEITEVLDGPLFILPDGQKWLMQ